MPNIIRQKRKANYTVIPNEMLNNTELSFKAKAILCYLLSKPDKWSVYLSQLAKASTDGYESVVSGMNELIAKNYVFRQPNSGVNPGGWEYFVYDEPQIEDDSRLSEKPTRDFADSGKPLTNKDRLSKVKKDIKENLLTSYEEEEESSAMASHSVLPKTDLFQTEPKSLKVTPTPNPPKGKSQVLEKPSGVSDQVWNDFIALRKAKRAPLSPTALSVISKEAEKAAMHIEEALTECVTRGWQSFKAEWMKPKTTTKPERFSNF